MPAKLKRTQTKTRRRRRTCKKGGMFRRGVTNILGKGFQRVDKAMQLGEAALKGATQSKPTETFTPTKSLQTFSASPFGMSESPHRRHKSSHNDDYAFKTPQKSHYNHNHEDAPKLGTRARRRETPEERRIRLGFMAAPTINDTVSVVEELFPPLL